MTEYTITVAELARHTTGKFEGATYALRRRDNIVKRLEARDDGLFTIHVVETVQYFDDGQKERHPDSYERIYHLSAEDELIIVSID